ncbi:hypothetical protein EDB87DRAFT_1752348 [Lactarius vividus]|nr:hypothetical protein EDB87DRAFT_1728148 [Lactarius vividus]KAH9057409.1 hypothetical protein EDB87DRAFT_1752348 [Lactarius vividus]
MQGQRTFLQARTMFAGQHLFAGPHLARQQHPLRTGLCPNRDSDWASAQCARLKREWRRLRPGYLDRQSDGAALRARLVPFADPAASCLRHCRSSSSLSQPRPPPLSVWRPFLPSLWRPPDVALAPQKFFVLFHPHATSAATLPRILRFSPDRSPSGNAWSMWLSSSLGPRIGPRPGLQRRALHLLLRPNCPTLPCFTLTQASGADGRFGTTPNKAGPRSAAT